MEQPELTCRFCGKPTIQVRGWACCDCGVNIRVAPLPLDIPPECRNNTLLTKEDVEWGQKTFICRLCGEGSIQGAAYCDCASLSSTTQPPRDKTLMYQGACFCCGGGREGTAPCDCPKGPSPLSWAPAPGCKADIPCVGACWCSPGKRQKNCAWCHTLCPIPPSGGTVCGLPFKEFVQKGLDEGKRTPLERKTNCESCNTMCPLQADGSCGTPWLQPVLLPPGPTLEGQGWRELHKFDCVSCGCLGIFNHSPGRKLCDNCARQKKWDSRSVCTCGAALSNVSFEYLVCMVCQKSLE